MSRFLGNYLARSPAFARVVPFLVFIFLTYLQGQFGEASRYWFYLAKTVVGAGMIWSLRAYVAEMKWSWSGPAVLTGVAVFILWIGLDGLYPSLPELGRKALGPLLTKLGLQSWLPADHPAPPVWNPQLQFGENSGLAWLFIMVRVLGSTIVVPPLEEVFYRSFLYRYISQPDFSVVPLGRFCWTPFLLTSVIFGCAHNEWLAGILCGLAFQGLVCWKKRLGDAMAAHALTNFLLGIWIVWKGAWHFW